jgi:hypothetical protein
VAKPRVVACHAVRRAVGGRSGRLSGFVAALDRSAAPVAQVASHATLRRHGPDRRMAKCDPSATCVVVRDVNEARDRIRSERLARVTCGHRVDGAWRQAGVDVDAAARRPTRRAARRYATSRPDGRPAARVAARRPARDAATACPAARVSARRPGANVGARDARSPTGRPGCRPGRDADGGSRAGALPRNAASASGPRLAGSANGRRAARCKEGRAKKNQPNSFHGSHLFRASYA